MSNLRFPKVFVYEPGTNALVAGTTAKPIDLAQGAVGVFNAMTLLGSGATPAPASIPNLQIHQNVGDSSYGTVRSKVIHAQKVKRWYGSKATAPAAQITYIGYDEVDATKTIAITRGQRVTLSIHLYDRKLQLWYGGQRPYVKNIPIELGFCDSSITDTTILDAQQVANLIRDAINGVTPAGEYPEGSELKTQLTASVVTASGKYGVKIVSNVVPEKILNSCDPKDFFDIQSVTFTVGFNSECASIPVSTPQTASVGSGWAATVANYERESQGYDRVRDQFDDFHYMAGGNFIIYARNGVKYDFYAIDFDWSHTTPGVNENIRTEPYSIYFYVPTGTGAALEALFNAWLTPLGFQAVTIAASTGVGSYNQVFNG